ncbi:unnamed protein product, partial [Medioppia subpectinata]
MYTAVTLKGPHIQHTDMEATSLTSNAVTLAKYLALTQPNNKVQVMYVWIIDGTNQHMGSQTKIVPFVPTDASELPLWTPAGASTGHEEGIYLLPVQLYDDPFRGGNNKLVMCETVRYDRQPTEDNHRHSCKVAMDLVRDQQPWFGVQQEYTPADGRHYEYTEFGAHVVDAHLKACLYAGIAIAGEKTDNDSKWEFQVGPCEGVTIGDDIWMARFLMQRVAKDFGVDVSFSPYDDRTGVLCRRAHCNFSTEAMREPGGMAAIDRAAECLSRKHDKHIATDDPRGDGSPTHTTHRYGGDIVDIKRGN